MWPLRWSWECPSSVLRWRCKWGWQAWGLLSLWLNIWENLTAFREFPAWSQEVLLLSGGLSLQQPEAWFWSLVRDGGRPPQWDRWAQLLDQARCGPGGSDAALPASYVIHFHTETESQCETREVFLWREKGTCGQTGGRDGESPARVVVRTTSVGHCFRVSGSESIFDLSQDPPMCVRVS